jgi:Domain of Unknown Function (DUF1080)
MFRRLFAVLFSALLAISAQAHEHKADATKAAGCEKCKAGACENCAKGVCAKCDKKEHCEKCAPKVAGCEKCKAGKCENCEKGKCAKCDKKEHCEKCEKKSECAACCAIPSGFKALFDGKSLKGWEQKNGTAKYSVVEGTILGETNEGSPNSFLCTEKDYENFELRFEVKVDNELNSGVQIRSRSKSDYDKGRVHGPQVEISTDGYAAYVYGEALKHTGGWLSPQPREKKTHELFKKGEWNSYVVRAEGSRIQTWLNGTAVTNIDDDSSGHHKGFIGLQVHGIKKGSGPFKVQWKNIFIKELKGNKEKEAKPVETASK